MSALARTTQAVAGNAMSVSKASGAALPKSFGPCAGAQERRQVEFESTVLDGVLTAV